MIKTEYLGWLLESLNRMPDHTWEAKYQGPEPLNFIYGQGHTPESSLASCQKYIKEDILKP